MDKSKYGKTALWIFICHAILSTASIVCVKISPPGAGNATSSLFNIGFRMGMITLILYPIVGGITYVVISIIGIIKSKKVLPYLIFPPISLIIWLISVSVLARYI